METEQDFFANFVLNPGSVEKHVSFLKKLHNLNIKQVHFFLIKPEKKIK